MRKFEYDDGRDDVWQVIIPKALRGNFWTSSMVDHRITSTSRSLLRSSDLASYARPCSSRLLCSNSPSSSAVRNLAASAAVESGTEESACSYVEMGRRESVCGYVEADRCEPATSATLVDEASTRRMQSQPQFRVGTWVPRGTPTPHCDFVQSALREGSKRPARRLFQCHGKHAC